MDAASGKHAHTNRLASETSPYLLQHAHNPVDWYPWGDEALTRAKSENKPILLSIGYSACHWCHVMERESFEDPEIARILNAHFIAIKVDREERPDLDQIYMSAVQAMTGSGGWPLNVFLTPDLKPFFGGTYFPPEDRYGRPGFGSLLKRIAEVWREKPDDLQRQAENLTTALRQEADTQAAQSGAIQATLVSGAVEHLARAFDPTYGGFGGAPKFPPSGAISILLREYQRTGDTKLLTMATITLDRMAYGGMYDQVGGGFHRYSTDERWLVPHFEKMLYDNALLARVYIEAWQVTGKDLYRRIATETLDYVLRDMTDPAGGFHSAEDADSEGEEGVFYVWRPEEIEATLGSRDGAFVCDYFGVSKPGNFEGRNILNVPVDPVEFARRKNITTDELGSRIERLNLALLAERAQRERPLKDDKVLAAWNGMMISALARGYQALGQERFRTAAERAADFVLTTMTRDGALLRTYRSPGHQDEPGVAKLPAYLDDYAEMANGLVDLYEATFDVRWLEAADDFARRMVTDFADEADGGFYYTSADHKNLIVRTKPYYDGAVPSGNATAALVLLRLAKLLDDDAAWLRAEQVLNSMNEALATHPRAYLNLLGSADFYLQPTVEIAIAGRRGAEDTLRMLEAVNGRFIPNRVLALTEPGTPAARTLAKRIPLLSGKAMIADKATVYVCESRVCKRPVTDVAALADMLDKPHSTRQTSAPPQDDPAPAVQP